MSYQAAPAAIIGRADQSKADAQKARELVEAALDPQSVLYPAHGPDRLLAAAQVYATLATR